MTGAKTFAIKMPRAMPVYTVVAEVSDGPDRGAKWEGERGTIGTAKGNDLVLTDQTVSGYHVRLTAVKGGIRVVDFGSTNGTLSGRGVPICATREGSSCAPAPRPTSSAAPPARSTSRRLKPRPVTFRMGSPPRWQHTKTANNPNGFRLLILAAPTGAQLKRRRIR